MDPLNEEEMLAYARTNSQEAFEAESSTLNYNREGTDLNREIFRYCQKWAEMVMTYDLTRLSSEYRLYCPSPPSSSSRVCTSTEPGRAKQRKKPQTLPRVTAGGGGGGERSDRFSDHVSSHLDALSTKFLNAVFQNPKHSIIRSRDLLRAGRQG
jgi:hypothetical protein